jgi:hypothetical protein
MFAQGEKQGETRCAISVIIMTQDGTAYMLFSLARDCGLVQKGQWALTLKGGCGMYPLHFSMFILENSHIEFQRCA